MTRSPSVSCVFVCHDGAGRILLARRSARARDEPGRWDCGAGALEFGESFEDAVTREVTEEYATAPLAIELLGVRNVVGGDPGRLGGQALSVSWSATSNPQALDADLARRLWDRSVELAG